MPFHTHCLEEYNQLYHPYRSESRYLVGGLHLLLSVLYSMCGGVPAFVAYQSSAAKP